jgi:hypothetical protein
MISIDVLPFHQTLSPIDIHIDQSILIQLYQIISTKSSPMNQFTYTSFKVNKLLRQHDVCITFTLENFDKQFTICIKCQIVLLVY